MLPTDLLAVDDETIRGALPFPGMSRFGSHYQVSRPTGLCAQTGRVMAPGEPCIAALRERDDEDGFERLDFSPEAWEAGARPEGLFSYWKTVVPDPQQKRRLLVDDQVLMDVFERLATDERPQRMAFRFVLGLILLRKKSIRLVGQERPAEPGAPARWHILPKGAAADQPPEILLDPGLTDEDVDDLTRQLGEILNAEMEDD